VFGADFDLTPWWKSSQSYWAIYKKMRKWNSFLFPIRIVFSLDRGGPYKCWAGAMPEERKTKISKIGRKILIKIFSVLICSQKTYF
jgi:hypothetical protein